MALRPVNLKKNTSDKCLCRVCGNSVLGKVYFNIFSHETPPSKGSRKLEERLRDSVGITITKFGQLPENICRPCYRLLEKIEELRNVELRFKESFKTTQEKLSGHNAQKRCSSVDESSTLYKKPRTQLPNQTDKAAKTGDIQQELINTTEDSLGPNLSCINLNVEPCPQTTVEVNIQYTSGIKRIQIQDKNTSKLIKQLAVGESSYAVNALWQNEDLKKCAISKCLKEVSSECSGLCSSYNKSILQKLDKNSISNFKSDVHVAELKDRAPLLYGVLLSACTQKRQTEEQQLKHVISMASSILLRQRSQKMSANAYRISTILWEGGAKKQV